MQLASTKENLAKRILETADEEIIQYIQAIFDSHPDQWFDDLPEGIQASVERGLIQSQKGEGMAHEEVMKQYAPWLNK